MQNGDSTVRRLQRQVERLQAQVANGGGGDLDIQGVSVPVNVYTRRGERRTVNLIFSAEMADDIEGLLAEIERAGYELRGSGDYQRRGDNGFMRNGGGGGFQRGQGGRRGACLNCGRYGHWANECPDGGR